ncbi:MAG: Alternative cytochrome c oxidase subunit 2 [Verrucomicrobia subdivision 3 bacterium]|nr:Alternative cytochrome c oxidase subunit 2 [Limisphaerales bacterium]MCS1417268.1 Alternative cytochrome c oxidase subunit 2 [Limisphaerales bacterium]
MFQKLLSLPVNKSVHGKEVDDFIIYIHWLMGFLFVIWMAYFLYVLWRFRATRHPKADHTGARTHASTYLEGFVAVIEGVLLLVFAVPLWAKIVDKAPRDPNTNKVRVMAQQFRWNFMYPGPDKVFGKQDLEFVTVDNKFGQVLDDSNGQDDFFTLNDLRVPAGEPTIFQISSLDVIHSFKVIALRVCQDAIPGISVPTWCVPLQEGRYQINCAQLCGSGHSNMTEGFLTVQSPEKFQAWIAEKAETNTGDIGGFE